MGKILKEYVVISEYCRGVSFTFEEFSNCRYPQPLRVNSELCRQAIRCHGMVWYGTPSVHRLALFMDFLVFSSDVY